MSIFFDVGANIGSWGLQKARENPGNIVYAFEPTPKFIELIQNDSRTLSNFFLIPKAASDIPGKAKFRLSQNGDWGCSSLLEFKEKEEILKRWPGRNDIGKTGEIEVECIRMDDFCRENKIEHIDFFHCDVQGMDLRVLQSFGDLISIVHSGEIEAVSSLDKAIYSEQTQTIEDCRLWLNEKGFRITDEIKNDPYDNEFNVVFTR